MYPSIYITYNPRSPIEESTALRLQTIANLYNVRVELPDRLGVGADLNTRQRISRASMVVAFPLKSLSKKVHNEINIALELQKPIVVVYDKKVGKTLNFKKYPENVFETTIDFDKNQMDDVLDEITQFFIERQANSSSKVGSKKKKQLSNDEKAGLGLLGVGLGLLLLAALSK